MRQALASLLIFSITSLQVFAGVAPNPGSPASPILAGWGGSLPAQYQNYESDYQVVFTPEQLDNLLAPIALYPDPLLAQVLLAATFPEQIDEAARSLRAYSRYDIDDGDWDVSVKAVAHYPAVLSMMADKIDWTTSVGQAYVNQSTDVMDAIQRLRRQARSFGNLVTTPEQEIVETDGLLYIYPASAQFIYVPTYDPAIVFFRRPAFVWGPLITFGMGFVIGAWLNHDCDWHHHRIFYHGWTGGPVWVVRSRPFVHPTRIYVDHRFDNIVINRRVIDRHVNYGALDRYRSIHRDRDFSDVRRGPGNVPFHREPGAGEAHRDNKIIRRNIDPNDARVRENRGYGQVPQAPPVVNAKPPIARVPRTDIPPSQPAPPVIAPGREEHGRRPDFHPNQPGTPTQPVTPVPQPRGEDRGRRPDFRHGQPVTPTQPVPQPQISVQPPPKPNLPPSAGAQFPRGPIFQQNQGGIDTRDASRRGQMSREQINHPTGTTNSTPRQTAPVNPPPRPANPHGRPR